MNKEQTSFLNRSTFGAIERIFVFGAGATAFMRIHVTEAYYQGLFEDGRRSYRF